MMENQEVKTTYICEFCAAPFTKKEEFLLHFTESSCRKQNICRIESSQESNPADGGVDVSCMEEAQGMQEDASSSTVGASQNNYEEVAVTSETPQILCTVDMILCEQGNKIFITPDAIRVAEQQDNLQQILSICEITNSSEVTNSGSIPMDIAQTVISTTQPEAITDLASGNVAVSVEAIETGNMQEEAAGVVHARKEEDDENMQEDYSKVVEHIVCEEQTTSQETISSDQPAFQCDVCMRRFKKASGLERHKVVHTRDNAQSYTCDVCGRIFTTLNRLLKHEEVHEKSREEEHRKKHEQQEAENSDKNEENKETFICETCGKTFTQSCCLLEHERVHFKENLKKGKEKFPCDQCDKSFQAASHLARHEKSHSKKKESFVCETCGETFPKNSLLSKHKITHTEVKPYICSVCGRGFMQSSNLTTHLRTHSKTKPYECRTCGKAFSHSSSRVIHERTHTGEKPYACETCSKTFRQSGDLAKHQRSHTGEKPYHCAVCDKAFSVQSNLLAHLRIHVKKNSQSQGTVSCENSQSQATVTLTMVVAEGSAGAETCTDAEGTKEEAMVESSA